MPVEQISEHVWWLPPGPPDRPSLCAVVGARWTLALDAGSSRAHTREFLDGLPARPAAVAYTHSHWDNVFGETRNCIGVSLRSCCCTGSLAHSNTLVMAGLDPAIHQKRRALLQVWMDARVGPADDGVKIGRI